MACFNYQPRTRWGIEAVSRTRLSRRIGGSCTRKFQATCFQRGQRQSGTWNKQKAWGGGGGAHEEMQRTRTKIQIKQATFMSMKKQTNKKIILGVRPPAFSPSQSHLCHNQMFPGGHSTHPLRNLVQDLSHCLSICYKGILSSLSEQWKGQHSDALNTTHSLVLHTH